MLVVDVFDLLCDLVLNLFHFFRLVADLLTDF